MNDTTENWQIRKPAVRSETGLVATQHYIASDIGAEVLRQGGNAVDAALAAGLALGAVEPWMTGIGGGGYMTIYIAATKEVPRNIESKKSIHLPEPSALLGKGGFQLPLPQT